jgi:hypothetical protein
MIRVSVTCMSQLTLKSGEKSAKDTAELDQLTLLNDLQRNENKTI